MYGQCYSFVLIFFKSKLKTIVKVTCSKFMVLLERSCHKEQSCQIWKGKKLWPILKCFYGQRDNYSAPVQWRGPNKNELIARVFKKHLRTPVWHRRLALMFQATSCLQLARSLIALSSGILQEMLWRTETHSSFDKNVKPLFKEIDLHRFLFRLIYIVHMYF